MTNSELEQALVEIKKESKRSEESKEVNKDSVSNNITSIEIEKDIERNNALNRQRSSALLNDVYWAVLRWICSLFTKEEGDIRRVKKRVFLPCVAILFLSFVFASFDFQTLYPFGKIPLFLIWIQEIAKSTLKALGYSFLSLLAYPVTNGFRNYLSNFFDKRRDKK